MGRAIIFANGEMLKTPGMLQDLQPGDVIIAADGGTYHCQALGMTPEVIIGDFDSLETDELASYEQQGVETIRYPSHKDETDLELALQYAQKHGFREIYVIGALGSRWDMTLANIMLIAHPNFSGINIHLLDGSQEFIILRGGQHATLHGQPGKPLSLIPLGGDCLGVSTQGLEYPLRDETLYFGAPRGVSNVFIADAAQVELKEGVLLCILNWAGFERE
jgi:thiamine pyrophosphokinase